MAFPLLPLVALGGFLALAASKAKAGGPGHLEFAAAKALQDSDASAVRQAARPIGANVPDEGAALQVEAQRISARKLGQVATLKPMGKYESPGLSEASGEFLGHIFTLSRDRMPVWANAFERAGAVSAAAAMRAANSVKKVNEGKSVDWQQTVADAIKSADPKVVSVVAAKLQQAGMTTQATQLSQTPLGEPQVVPASASAPVIRTPASSPKKLLAQRLTDYLRTTSSGREDRSLVKSFQTQENLKVDGLYGPQSALAVASYDIIPVKPFYWPRVNAEAAKQAYAKAMLEHAQKEPDPARAQLWQLAAKNAYSGATQMITEQAPNVSYAPTLAQQVAAASTNLFG